MEVKDGLFGSGEGQNVVEHILEHLGQLHWIVGGLSIIAHLVHKVEKVSQNKLECLKLLRHMFDLAERIKLLKDQMPEEEEKFRVPLVIIVKGCMICASQLDHGKFFRFLKSSVDSQALNDLSSEIDRLYPDLTVDALTAIKKGQPIYLPVLHPKYPKGAVGLQKPLEELKQMLDLKAADVSSRVVVIYGFGGIGKTTLSNALCAILDEDLQHYNRTKVQINKEQNDFKCMQQQILRDCFPTYQHGREILVRNCEEGRNHITEAFNCEANKPLFIFIDNALRSNDLQELLPEDLRGLPQHCRILVTTRNLAVTDVFEDSDILRLPYAVSPLGEEHALQILCKDSAHLQQISKDVEKILRIAGGIPLVLKIVGAQLRKQKYKVENCLEILEALEAGGEVIEGNMSERLVHLVYNGLEPFAREAFLDICSFFSGNSRRFVEYIVGGAAVTSLAEAALLTVSPFYNSVEDVIKEQDIYREGEERVIVHDVIQAKGRRMGESTRIKDLKSWSRAAESQVQGIKGVWLEIEYQKYGEGQRYIVEERHLSWLNSSVRILYLGRGISISARSPETFEKLRYLHLDTGIHCFPMNIEGLPSLSVYEGSFFEEVVSKFPKKLKYLSFDFHSEAGNVLEQSSSDLESKSIQAVRNSSLEELVLFGVKEGMMRRMFDGRLHFDALKILRIHNDEMEELPPQVCCALPSLNRLSLACCSSLKRVPEESIANLRALTHLDLSGCWELEDASLRSLGELTALRCLSLCMCVSLTKLPDNFGQLTALRCLNICLCWDAGGWKNCQITLHN